MVAALDLAAQQIGLNERDQKAALSEYLQNGGQNLDPATTAWCAAFVDATLRQTGGKGTGKLNARSYMNWGQGVDDPQPGDIAVFSRGDPNGWQGHVGFFQGYDDQGNIQVLGGNQGDAVSIASYSPDRLLGFRRDAQADYATRPQNRLTQGRNGQQAPQGQQRPQNALSQPELRIADNRIDPRQFMTQRAPVNRLTFK